MSQKIIIEDEEDIRLFIREALEGQGYKIMSTVDGITVLKKVHTNVSTLILILSVMGSIL